MVQVCEGTKSKGVMLQEAIDQYKDIFMRARNGFNTVVAVSLGRAGCNIAHQYFSRAFKTGWNLPQARITEVVVRAVAVVEGQGEVGEVDQRVGLGWEEEVQGVQTTTTTTIQVETLVAVQAVVTVVAAEQEEDEGGHRHRHRPLGPPLPQKIYWTRIFSLVSLFITLCRLPPNLLKPR